MLTSLSALSKTGIVSAFPGFFIMTFKINKIFRRHSQSGSISLITGLNANEYLTYPVLSHTTV